MSLLLSLSSGVTACNNYLSLPREVNASTFLLSGAFMCCSIVVTFIPEGVSLETKRVGNKGRKVYNYEGSPLCCTVLANIMALVSAIIRRRRGWKTMEQKGCPDSCFKNGLFCLFLAVKNNSPKPAEEEKKEKAPQPEESSAETEKEGETKMEH